jgi:hypothetical protein
MRCINPAQVTKGSRNLKSVALETAEISSTQISTNAGNFGNADNSSNSGNADNSGNSGNADNSGNAA